MLLWLVDGVVDGWCDGQEPGEDGQDLVGRNAHASVLFSAGERVHWRCVSDWLKRLSEETVELLDLVIECNPHCLILVSKTHELVWK